MFQAGTTPVNCTATDTHGNAATGSFPVTVNLLDVMPPVVTVPGPIAQEATSGSGAVVSFSASAVDNVDGASVTLDEMIARLTDQRADASRLHRTADEEGVTFDKGRVTTPRGFREAYAQLVEGGVAHAGHDAHVRHDVGAVGDLDAHLAERRAQRAHHVGHHVHRAALHRALEQALELRVRLGGRHPVVGRAGVFLVLRADVGAVLDAGDIPVVRTDRGGEVTGA